MGRRHDQDENRHRRRNRTHLERDIDSIVDQYEMRQCYDEDMLSKDDLIGKQKISLLPYFRVGGVPIIRFQNVDSHVDIASYPSFDEKERVNFKLVGG